MLRWFRISRTGLLSCFYAEATETYAVSQSHNQSEASNLSILT